MKTTMLLPAKNWPQLIAAVQAQVIEQAHRGAGQWQTVHVRLDVPPHLAQTPASQLVPLTEWLEQLNLEHLVFASRRADARLEIKSSKI